MNEPPVGKRSQNRVWVAIVLALALGGCAVVPISRHYDDGSGAAVVVSPATVLIAPWLHWSVRRHWGRGHSHHHGHRGRGRSRGWH